MDPAFPGVPSIENSFGHYLILISTDGLDLPKVLFRFEKLDLPSKVVGLHSRGMADTCLWEYEVWEYEV